MVWVQILSREEQNLTALKSNSNTVWFNFQTYIIYIYIFFIYLLIISLLIAHLLTQLLKVYFTGNKTILFKQIALVAYMTLSIFPCCYYVHCMYVFHIVNHCNCYVPCGSLIGQ
jgi:hypothetical protein